MLKSETDPVDEKSGPGGRGSRNGDAGNEAGKGNGQKGRGKGRNPTEGDTVAASPPRSATKLLQMPAN